MPKLEKESVRLKEKERERGVAKLLGKEGRKGISNEGGGQSSDEEEDKEWPCLICGEPFANSRSKETWVQCWSCKQWAHEECTTGESYFVCLNCDSDEHSEDSDY